MSRLGAQATHLSGLGVEKILAVGGLSGGCCGLGPRGGLLGRGGCRRGGRVSVAGGDVDRGDGWVVFVASMFATAPAVAVRRSRAGAVVARRGLRRLPT